MHKYYYDFQNDNLEYSIKYAVRNVPFYGEISRRLRILKAFRKTSPRDVLRLFPPTRKNDLITSPQKMISKRARIYSAVMTSGTLTPSIPIYLTRKEMEARTMWKESFSGVDVRSIAIRFTLRRFGSFFHGDRLAFVCPYIPEDPWRIDTALLYLKSKYVIPGRDDKISSVSVSPPWLIRLMTQDLESKASNPRTLGIKMIDVAGGHLTQSLRRYVNEKWGAETTSSYSLAEMCGAAARCRVSNEYHVDSTMKAEVLDYKTEHSLVDGTEGMLALTSFHPFQEAMPLIRYVTGDLASLRTGSCECGFVGDSISLRGRVEYCVNLSDVLSNAQPRRWLSAIDIQEILEDIPELTNTIQSTRRIYPSPNGPEIVQVHPLLNFRVDRIGTQKPALIKMLIEHDGTNDENKRLSSLVLDSLNRRCEVLQNTDAVELHVDVLSRTESDRLRVRYFARY
jgi:phenylacetate-coenzyme A ligase PaaK-like adenylate-forming protein